ncbi:MAG: YcaO-like family protein [Sporolactobacillus sp.]
MKYGSGTIKELFLYNSIFLNNFNVTRIVPYSRGDQGFSLSNGVGHSIKSALGEHLERISVYKNNFLLDNDYIKAYSFKEGSTKKVPAYYVSLIHDTPESKNFYTDTSGVASHTNSNQLITNSFLEFVERQSLVFSFLTEDPGLIVPENYTRLIKNFSSKARQYIDNIIINDISIFDDVFVILIVGLGTKYHGIGLGSGLTLDDAIFSAFREFFCFFWDMPTKELTDQGNESQIQTVNDDRINQLFLAKNDPYVYSSIFSKLVNSKYLYNKFSYLVENNNRTIVEEKDNIDHKGIIELILKFVDKFQIDILLSYIPFDKLNLSNKMIKIFSIDGYPHINTLMIDPNKYKMSFIKDVNQKFPNSRKYLPFP